MLETKQLSYKKFSVQLDIPVYSSNGQWSYQDGDKWITLKYMVRYRIPITTTGQPLKPCDDKKFLKDFFERKFKGGYQVTNTKESVRLEDGRLFDILVPNKIRVYKPIQELRDISLDDLLNDLV